MNKKIIKQKFGKQILSVINENKNKKSDSTTSIKLNNVLVTEVPCYTLSNGEKVLDGNTIRILDIIEKNYH